MSFPPVGRREGGRGENKRTWSPSHPDSRKQINVLVTPPPGGGAGAIPVHLFYKSWATAQVSGPGCVWGQSQVWVGGREIRTIDTLLVGMRNRGLPRKPSGSFPH